MEIVIKICVIKIKSTCVMAHICITLSLGKHVAQLLPISSSAGRLFIALSFKKNPHKNKRYVTPVGHSAWYRTRKLHICIHNEGNNADVVV